MIIETQQSRSGRARQAGSKFCGGRCFFDSELGGKRWRRKHARSVWSAPAKRSVDGAFAAGRAHGSHNLTICSKRFRGMRTPTASIIPALGKAQGTPAEKSFPALKARIKWAMRQAAGLQDDRICIPWALPRAGMGQAFGLRGFLYPHALRLVRKRCRRFALPPHSKCFAFVRAALPSQSSIPTQVY